MYHRVVHRIPSTADDSSPSPRRATAPTVSYDGTLHDIGRLNPPGDGDSDDDGAGTNGHGTRRGNNQKSTASATYDRPESGEGGEEVAGGAEGDRDGGRGGESDNDKPEEDPFEKGYFFFKVDDKDKGHYKVRDVSRFLLTSMYKRKDRVTRTAGVSLLVGKLEDPPHEEKVISALFDTDRFSERAAAQWWEDNGHRFEDARSLAEKKVRSARACLLLFLF